MKRAWEKDYFTSSLPWQQRGTAPALPLSGVGSVNFAGAGIYDTGIGIYPGNSEDPTFYQTIVPANSADVVSETANPNAVRRPLQVSKSELKNLLDNNSFDFSNATTFNVSDLRLAFQIQKWLERNARGGVRYTEFLRSHFGVSPRDDRLQRPEYLGGSKSPIIISEVLQTSGSNITGQSTPQGNLSGHGLTADKNSCFTYHAKEFGYILGILSVMPKPSYQQGINKQWLRFTKYDFYFPEFSHLSEQAVTEEEIYAIDGADSQNGSIFGYQGRYNEMRYKPNQVCGGLRDTFAYWHLGRQFSAPPNLNSGFITCVPRKDIFVSQNEKGLIVNFANIIYASRPMPYISDPGLIDHN